MKCSKFKLIRHFRRSAPVSGDECPLLKLRKLEHSHPMASPLPQFALVQNLTLWKSCPNDNAVNRRFMLHRFSPPPFH